MDFENRVSKNSKFEKRTDDRLWWIASYRLPPLREVQEWLSEFVVGREIPDRYV